MQVILRLLDWVWSLKALTGMRTKIARAVIIGLPAYQALATAPALIKAGLDLPDVNAAVLAAIMAWLGSKIPGFTKEHKPS